MAQNHQFLSSLDNVGKEMRYTVILEPEEEGGFHIWYPALKGRHSQGDTKEEALDNI